MDIRRSNLDFEDFCNLASTKGRAVKLINESSKKHNLSWMVVYESEYVIEIEIRGSDELKVLKKVFVELVRLCKNVTVSHCAGLFIRMEMNK